MTWRIEHGDCFEVMRAMPDASVHCCVTSPPYWGLRDYGHEDQIGLEQTPEEYVAKMVAVFREVRRLLRDDGTLWLNLGDSYAAGGTGGASNSSTLSGGGGRYREGSKLEAAHKIALQRSAPAGLKPKDLVGIPWRVAFALQADGWWLRQDIIWHKPNPMPESVTDRCTKAHEYVFLLSKSARYWWDAGAVKEDCTPDMQRRAASGHTRGAGGKVDASRCDATTLRGEHAKVIDASAGRNRRSVWSITTQPFSGAHFATMPPTLAELCIKAGCPKDGIVLDPFAGAGTTGLVADRLGRSFVGIELNADYLNIARSRISADAPLFAGLP